MRVGKTFVEKREKVEQTRARMMPNQRSTRSLRPNAKASWREKRKEKREETEARASRDKKCEGMGQPAHGPRPDSAPSSTCLPHSSAQRRTFDEADVKRPRKELGGGVHVC
jgi:hypothetical protein